MVWYIFLASPKSATFSTKPSPMSTFLAARSRWMHCDVCVAGVNGITFSKIIYIQIPSKSSVQLSLWQQGYIILSLCVHTFFDERCSIPLAICPAILTSCRVQRGFWESLRLERR